MHRLAVLATLALLVGTPTLALADISPEPNKPKKGSGDGCTIDDSGDAGLLGSAALALLLSGAALRRRAG